MVEKNISHQEADTVYDIVLLAFNNVTLFLKNINFRVRPAFVVFYVMQVYVGLTLQYLP